MNKGKRLIRNTVFTMWGLVAVLVGMNRLYESTVDAATPPWVRGALSLGLTIQDDIAQKQMQQQTDLASLKDFTRINVTGHLKVEVVTADKHKVTLIPAVTALGGKEATVRSWQNGDMVRIAASADAAGAVLRIETPTLDQVYAQGLQELSLHDIRAERVTVVLGNVSATRLRQNSVAHWSLISTTTSSVLVDKETLAAGELRTGGALAIRFSE